MCNRLLPNRRTETQAQSAMDLEPKWLRSGGGGGGWVGGWMEWGGGGGADVELDMCVCPYIPAACIGGHVPVDTAPGPVPVYKSL